MRGTMRRKGTSGLEVEMSLILMSCYLSWLAILSKCFLSMGQALRNHRIFHAQNSCGKENETSLVACMYKLAGIYQIPEQRK